MEWIPVEKRLPDDRRRVLVWIEARLMGRAIRYSPAVSRFNPGDRFDVEKPGSWFILNRVTHWCEIESPAVTHRSRSNG